LLRLQPTGAAGHLVRPCLAESWRRRGSKTGADAFTCDAVEAAISTSFQGEILRNRPYSYGRNTPRLRTVRPNITYGGTGALCGHSKRRLFVLPACLVLPAHDHPRHSGTRRRRRHAGSDPRHPTAIIRGERPRRHPEDRQRDTRAVGATAGVIYSQPRRLKNR
jgi:hypothetical protein